jgi:peroxiredoxin
MMLPSSLGACTWALADAFSPASPASAAEMAQQDALRREAAAIQHELDEQLTICMNASDAWAQSLSLERDQMIWDERGKIRQTIRTFRRLTQMRLVIEILFPAAYAVFALVWTVFHA